MVGQSGARIVGEAGRAAREVGDGQDNVGGLFRNAAEGVPYRIIRLPDFLAVEGAAVGQILISHPPAAVAPFDDVYPAGLIAAVAVVVAREEVAVVVERQLLRVAEAGGKNLQVPAIELAAED